MIPEQENLTDAFKKIYKEKNPILTKGNLHGLERECLRVDLNANLSLNPHPVILGASLTHPSITTDFSESQIEFTTQPYTSIQECLAELKTLQHFVCESIKDELLWPMSMPALLPQDENQIPLARYGNSKQGQNKTIYRRGLGNRYGRRMQTISGVHYNYSFGNDLLDYLHNYLEGRGLAVKNKHEFKTQIYFHTIRNFFRYSFFIPYLFGASNSIDESFFYGSSQIDSRLTRCNKRTFINPVATSLRMSRIGYTNSHQDQLNISYDRLDSYLSGLKSAITTHYPEYEKYSIQDKQQLNSNLLQIENEYYSILRPKPDLKGYDSSIDALRDRGVEYIEIRGLDLSPTLPLAVDENRMSFIHMLLLHCLFLPSPSLNNTEWKQIQKSFDEVVWDGRNQNSLPHEKIKQEGLRLMENLEPLAELLDLESKGSIYSDTIKRLRTIIIDPMKCETCQTMNRIQEGMDMIELGMELAVGNCKYFDGMTLPQSDRKKLEQLAKLSIQKQKEIEDIQFARTI